MTGVIECLVELSIVVKSVVRDVVEREDVLVLTSRVGVEVGDPSGFG